MPKLQWKHNHTTHLNPAISSTTMQMRRLSADGKGTHVTMWDGQECHHKAGVLLEPGTHFIPNFSLFLPGKYVASVYDSPWYIRQIIERNYEEQDVVVNFMKQVCRNSFS